MNIEDFKNNFIFGGARPNLYEVYIPSLGGSADVAMKFLCRATSIPSSPIGRIDIPYMGRKIPVAGDRTFPDWSTTVINDEDWKIRRAVELWNNNINKHADNIRTKDYNITDAVNVFGGSSGSYKRDGYVIHKAKDGSAIAKYKFVGMYPQDVGTIELAYDSNDVAEEFTVTWAYDYFTTEEATGKSGAAVGNIE